MRPQDIKPDGLYLVKLPEKSPGSAQGNGQWWGTRNNAEELKREQHWYDDEHPDSFPARALHSGVQLGKVKDGVIIQVWCRRQRLQEEIISELYASDTFIEPFKDPKTGRVDHEVYQADLTIRARSVLCPLPEQHPAHHWMAEQEEAKLSLREVERGAQLGAMLRRHLAEQVELKEQQLKEREDFEEHFDERFDEHERQLRATAHQGVRPKRGRRGLA